MLKLRYDHPDNTVEVRYMDKLALTQNYNPLKHSNLKGKYNKKRVVATMLIAAVATTLYFAVDPRTSELMPKCMWMTLTGWKCPGCGSQRAIYYILHGEIYAAIVENPLLMLFLPYVALGVYLEYFGGQERFPKLRERMFGVRAIVVVGVIIVAFGVIRNIV